MLKPAANSGLVAIGLIVFVSFTYDFLQGAKANVTSITRKVFEQILYGFSEP